jgi:predicted GNAT family acetyltransferase
MTEPEVVHVPEESRYELRIDGQLVGVADYRLRDDRVVFTHTEVDPDRREHGLGSMLVKAALDDARGKELVVIPVCPFVARYIEEHHEYAKLLPDG